MINNNAIVLQDRVKKGDKRRVVATPFGESGGALVSIRWPRLEDKSGE